MNTLFFETGDYITDENGEPLYVLATPARYNDKYYVVRAVETKTNRDCLLKFVEITDDSYKLNNLQREGAFCFYHPYIEHVYGNFTGITPSGEKIYGVELEFVKGKTLKDFRFDLEKKIAFDEITEEQAEWLVYRQMMQFLYGMKYYTEYSRQAYLHRDIKPENVMISDRNSDVVIVDFDFSHIAGSKKTMNVAGWDIGFSNGYTSPAIFTDKKITEWDISTDVYSAGRLFFFWLNGREYFTDEQLKTKHENLLSSTIYCMDKEIGYGIKANKDRFKKKYLGKKYEPLRDILAKMCCNPDTNECYTKVSDIISDMKSFLLDQCNGSWDLLETKLELKKSRLNHEEKSVKERKHIMVVCKNPDGEKTGSPLYEASVRDIIWDGKIMFSVCNYKNKITVIPLPGRDIDICSRQEIGADSEKGSDSHKSLKMEIKDGDKVVCDGAAFELTIR